MTCRRRRDVYPGADAVAERAGVAVGTLYRYFPSTVHLLVSVLGREFERLGADYDWAAVGGTPHQRLRWVIAASIGNGNATSVD